MPAGKISADPAIVWTDIADADALAFIDASEAAALANKRLTIANLRGLINIPKPPALADHMAVTRGTAAIVDAGGAGISFNVPAVTSGDAWNYVYRAAPAIPYTLTARFRGMRRQINVSSWGPLVMDAATGKFVSLESIFLSTGGDAVEFNRWTNTTTFGANAWKMDAFDVPPTHLRLVVEATNIYAEFSPDGRAWFRASTPIGTTNAGAADRIGFGVKATTAAGQIFGNLVELSAA